MVDDRLEVAVGEPACLGGQPKRPVNLTWAHERGKLGRPPDLRPDPLGPRRRSEDEPALGSGSEFEEGRLVWARGLGVWMERIGRPLGIVSGIYPWVARSRESVPSSLASPGRTDVGDDELVAVDAHPDPLADELVRHRVARRAIADRGFLVDDAGDPEGDRVRLVGHRVEALALLGKQVDRRASGLAVLAGVDLLAERIAGNP